MKKIHTEIVGKEKLVQKSALKMLMKLTTGKD